MKGSFNGFDRSPYLATFTAEAFTFSLVTAHLFFGSDKSPTDITRRSLKAAAVAWWTNRRHRNKYAPTKDVLALGDMNLPKTDKSDPIYRALTRKGLRPPEHSTLIGSNLESDMHYDQIMFFPGDTKPTSRARLVSSTSTAPSSDDSGKTRPRPRPSTAGM